MLMSTLKYKEEHIVTKLSCVLYTGKTILACHRLVKLCKLAARFQKRIISAACIARNEGSDLREMLTGVADAAAPVPWLPRPPWLGSSCAVHRSFLDGRAPCASRGATTSRHRRQTCSVMAAVLLPCTIIVSCQRGRERSLRCDGCLLDRISLALSLPTALLPWPTEAGGRYPYI